VAELVLVRPLDDLSAWTEKLDTAAGLWEMLADAEGICRLDRPISASAANKFAGELLLLSTPEQARAQMRRDPKGARSFADFLHEASDLIRAGDMRQPPTLSEEHMPFYLPTLTVKEAIRHSIALGRGHDYDLEPPSMQS
jgi:hypothetical protein